MIGKIIKLSNGSNYYVLDGFERNKRIFLFGVEVDNENDLTTNNCSVYELKCENEKYSVIDIPSEELEQINNIFISRLHNA